MDLLFHNLFAFVFLFAVSDCQYFERHISETSLSDCDSSNVEKCTASVQKLYGVEDILVHNNPDELRDLCLHTQSAMNCINSYVVRCLDDTHRNLYRDLTGGLQDFIQEFCNENSEFSIEYRRHLPCYNNLTEKYHDCSGYIVQAEEKVSAKKLSLKGAMKVICCHYFQSVNCYHRVTLEHCSEEAANFAQVIFRKILANNTRLLQCDKHTYDDPSCRAVKAMYKSNSSDVFQLEHWLFILVFVFTRFFKT